MIIIFIFYKKCSQNNFIVPTFFVQNDKCPIFPLENGAFLCAICIKTVFFYDENVKTGIFCFFTSSLLIAGHHFKP